jgi:hypothetical protein
MQGMLHQKDVQGSSPMKTLSGATVWNSNTIIRGHQLKEKIDTKAIHGSHLFCHHHHQHTHYHKEILQGGDQMGKNLLGPQAPYLMKQNCQSSTSSRNQHHLKRRGSNMAYTTARRMPSLYPVSPFLQLTLILRTFHHGYKQWSKPRRTQATTGKNDHTFR